jgi:hypothetical protein
MASVTYQQLLAETYKQNEHIEENFSDEEPDVEGHEEHEYDTKELADQDAFKKFAGNRGHPETISKPSPFDDKSKLSIRHEKDMKTIVLNIDSRFRSYATPNEQPKNPIYSISIPSSPDVGYIVSDPAHYVMQTHTPIRNVYSVKLTSVEFPNVFYEFDRSLYVNTEINITIDGTTTPIVIPDGNYSTSDILASTLQSSLNDSLSDFTVLRDPISNRITITHAGVFDITFVTRITNSITGQVVNSPNPYKNGLGYYLGFSQTTYTGLTSYTAELVPTIVANNYVYLVLNDWNVVQHQSFNNTHFSAFSKLLITGPKNTLFFDTASSNSTTKEIFFQQPVDITRIEMQLLDPYGNQLNLRGADFSITLEIKQILNMSLFEKLREL